MDWTEKSRWREERELDSEIRAATYVFVSLVGSALVVVGIELTLHITSFLA